MTIHKPTDTEQRMEARGESEQSSEPVSQRIDGQLILHWKNRNYNARYAAQEDVVHILEGVTETIEGEDQEKGTELGKELSKADTKEAEEKASSEIHQQVEKSKDVTEHGFRELRKFFQDLLAQNAFAPDTHTPHLFVIGAASLDRITRLNKGELNNTSESPVMTNQENFFDRSTGFALSRENGERLKKLIEDVHDTRFRINHEFSEGFVLNINGREFAFFTIPKEEVTFEAQRMAPTANDNASASETQQRPAA